MNIIYVATTVNGKFFNIEEVWCPEGYLKKVSTVSDIKYASKYYHITDIEALIEEYQDVNWLFSGEEFIVSGIKSYEMVVRYIELGEFLK